MRGRVKTRFKLRITFPNTIIIYHLLEKSKPIRKCEFNYLTITFIVLIIFKILNNNSYNTIRTFSNSLVELHSNIYISITLYRRNHRRADIVHSFQVSQAIDKRICLYFYIVHSFQTPKTNC